MKLEKGELISIIRGVESQYISSIINVLLEEGIKAVEVSLSDEEIGLQSIREISKDFGNKVRLGVGTVLTTSQVDRAIEAGAKYIITPGWNEELVKYIKTKPVEVLPGVYSPGEIMQAMSEGIEVVKLFPAGNLGINYIKNLFGPFPRLHIVAVGGINKNNIEEYYRAGCYSFAIGNDLVPRVATLKDIEQIRQNAREYIKIISQWK